MSKTIGIIIARMSSGRLPGKVLRPLNEKPLLEYTLERMRQVAGLHEIWLATTQHSSDAPLVKWAEDNGLLVLPYSGEMDDVVGRVTAVLKKAEADRFLGVLGDTPFTDVRFLNRLISESDQHPDWEALFVDESQGRSVHTGLLCYHTSGWLKLDSASQKPHYREHCGSVLVDQPNLLSIGYVQDEPLYYDASCRLTVDTQADLDFCSKIAEALQPMTPLFSMADILNYLKTHPELLAVNRHVRQRNFHEEALCILVAVQAGGTFGTGHLARSRTLAKALQEYQAAEVTFWLEGDCQEFQTSLKAEGFQVIEGSWSLSEVLRHGNYNRVVVDFQSPVTPSLVQSIRSVNPDVPVIVIDNNGLGCADADAVIFPNAHALPNPEWQLNQNRIYQGPSYVLLGAGFLSGYNTRTYQTRSSLPSILVTMGGSDPELLSESVLYALKDLKDCHIDLVVPLLYRYPENLEKLATHMPSTITLHWKVQNLQPLMEQATLAIAAFGVTAYELAYMGIPTLLVGHTPAQVEDIERFCEWGSAFNLGWGKKLDMENLLSRVYNLIQDESSRALMSEKGHRLVNSQGPLRVSEAIRQTKRQPIFFHSDRS